MSQKGGQPPWTISLDLCKRESQLCILTVRVPRERLTATVAQTDALTLAPGAGALGTGRSNKRPVATMVQLPSGKAICGAVTAPPRGCHRTVERLNDTTLHSRLPVRGQPVRRVERRLGRTGLVSARISANAGVVQQRQRCWPKAKPLKINKRSNAAGAESGLHNRGLQVRVLPGLFRCSASL
jgi:hypothetical protein